MEQILELVEEYITKKHAEKKWVAGQDWVQYSGPYYNSEEYVAAVRTLLGEWLVLGNDAIKFERKFPLLFGKKLGVLTNSGSSANLLMMSALTSKNGKGLPKGTKVLCPVAGFPTTINPILQVGFDPVFVDIELDTLNLNLDQVEYYCQMGHIKVITFAHVLGNPPNMDRVMEIVNKYNLILLEDCCDALGSTYDGKMLGGFGTMASCSFYPAHHLSGGESGIVCVNDLDTERIVKSFREWGRSCYCSGKASLLADGTCGCRFSNWLPSMPDQIFDHKYVYSEIGYNLKPIELQASILLVQLKKLDEIITKRKRNYKMLYEVFKKYDYYFHLHEAQPKSDPSWFAFPITLRDDCPFKRSDICTYFESQKIQTRPYFAGNIMLQPAYEGIRPSALTDYPVATKATTDTFFLGTSPVITEEKIKYIKEVLERFIEEY